jgi:hypothetical protein
MSSPTEGFIGSRVSLNIPLVSPEFPWRFSCSADVDGETRF